jgi:hypothetical protein
MIRKSRMVLATPGPLLTPPPSSSPPKTPHRSYSAQTRSQDEEKISPWFGEPRRARRAFRARPPTQSVSCCSAVSLCRREVAQWLLSSVLESSGLITSCAAHPRDPARPVSSNHRTVCPCAGYLQDVFYCDPQYRHPGDQKRSREQFPSVVNYSTSNNISSTQADSRPLRQRQNIDTIPVPYRALTGWISYHNPP